MISVPLYIISGFLGSGKTTFLKNIADIFLDDRKIAIIQTEFPLSSIERGFKDIVGKSLALLELNRGSVSKLSLSDNAPYLIADFIEKEKPDVVFLEASGLADIHGIINVLSNKVLENKVFFVKSYVVTDASRFDQEVTFLRSVRRQIRVADCVLINKFEKLNRLESPDKILKSYNYNKIFSGIREMAPFANIIPTLYSRLPQDELNAIAGSSIGIKPTDNHVLSIKSDKILKDKNAEDLYSLLRNCDFTKGYLMLHSKNVAFKLLKRGELSITDYKSDLDKNEIVARAPDSVINSIIKFIKFVK